MSPHDSMSTNDGGAGSVRVEPVKCPHCGIESDELTEKMASNNRFVNALLKQVTADMEKMTDHMEQCQPGNNPGSSDEDEGDDDDDDRRPRPKGCKWYAELYFREETLEKFSTRYIWLYGLSPEIVSKIRDSATIAALDAHASDVRSSTREITYAYKDAFTMFIQALKDSNYPRYWIENTDSAVYEAYCNFIQQRRTKPKRV